MPAAFEMSCARELWEYPRLSKPGNSLKPVRCLLVFGGQDLGLADRTAELYTAGIAPFVVVSGGSRAVPDGSDFPTEADAIMDVLLRREVPKDVIALKSSPPTPARTSGCQPSSCAISAWTRTPSSSTPSSS